VFDFIKKLFGQKSEPAVADHPTAPEDEQEKSAALPVGEVFSDVEPSESEQILTAPLADAQDFVNPGGAVEPAQFISVVGQSVGKQRDHNEDTLFALSAILATDASSQPLGIYIIADGMGGHQHGELASGVAAKTVANHLINRLYAPFYSLDPEPPSDPLQEMMKDAISEAQRMVIKQVPGGGTTLTAVVLLGEQMTLAHVGDSRAYLIHPDNRFQLISHDHSLVQRLVELGQITDEEALTHPQRNVVYRAIGQMEPFEPDISTLPLPKGGYILLCSDGLWGVVPENKVLSIIRENSDLGEASRLLLKAANDNGGPDNISLVLVKCP